MRVGKRATKNVPGVKVDHHIINAVKVLDLQ
jgi:hypothetical protein